MTESQSKKFLLSLLPGFWGFAPIKGRGAQRFPGVMNLGVAYAGGITIPKSLVEKVRIGLLRASGHLKDDTSDPQVTVKENEEHDVEKE